MVTITVSTIVISQAFVASGHLSVMGRRVGNIIPYPLHGCQVASALRHSLCYCQENLWDQKAVFFPQVLVFRVNWHHTVGFFDVS